VDHPLLQKLQVDQVVALLIAMVLTEQVILLLLVHLKEIMVERLQAELVTELQAVAVQQLLDKLQQVQHQDKVMVEQAQQHQFQDHLLHTLVVEVEVNGVLVALDLVEQVAVELEDLVQEVLPQEQMEVPIEVVEVAEETQMVLQQVAKEDLV
jgi:hypothetical protein